MIDFSEPVYIVTVLFFLIGMLRMSNPATAKSGILWAGIAMAVSIVVTFLIPGISNLLLIVAGVFVGAVIGWVAARKVSVVDMPQMVAVYNGMGAGAASAIAAIELLQFSEGTFYLNIAMVGAIIGNVSIAGSLIAFLKLQGWMPQRPLTFKGQFAVNVVVLFIAIYFGFSFFYRSVEIVQPIYSLSLFVVFSLLYGFFMALPIGGADMPVLISLYNAMTGIAVSMDGFSINNYAMLIAGILVGAAGTILTIAMARAMNRSVGNILIGGFGGKAAVERQVRGDLKPISPEDVAVMLRYASLVSIVPGFGMASAQAQFKVRELLGLLQSLDVKVYFAIHPVAGRMPGHMNVLLAEAGVDYDLLVDLEDANRQFPEVDVALVIGANDVVNPAARTEGTAIFGMPILDVDKTKNVIVMKRGSGKGYAGIENDLFYLDRTRMLYGDAQDSVSRIIQELKKL